MEKLAYCVWCRCYITVPFKRWLIHLLEKSDFLVRYYSLNGRFINLSV